MGMFRKIFFIIYCFTINAIVASDKEGLIFIEQLLEWNIDFQNLENNKAGAACLPISSKTNYYNALGISYSLAEIEYAKRVAMNNCQDMKRKKKILSECKCEIIFINNSFIGVK